MALEILSTLISLDCLLALIAGTLGGMIFGALPGLSATMAMSLMIPFTYKMDPAPAMVMVGAIYVSAVYGGSFSAILIRTPGTPASAATAIDGYELTKQGKGLQAVGISTISSVIGGVFSAVCLLIIAPQLAKLSLRFSAPEYFLVAIFGLTIVGSLAAGNMLKGLIAAAFGLILGMVGMNIFPYPRYSFGNLNLASGIQLVPAMIGFFSISQILMQAEKVKMNLSFKAKTDEQSKADSEALKKMIHDAMHMEGRFLPKWKEFVSLLPCILRASALGLLVGILPGAGGDIGSWVGYNSARSHSKNKELFGHGSLEGVAASEAGNNAVCGGALIPAMTLGIPGSGAAAVFLGALTVQGFTPGAALFSTHGTMTYTILFGFLFANILMGICGWLCSKQAVRLTSLPLGILLPVIMVLSVIGSFAIRNNIFDVYVALFFGVVGYLMRKVNIPGAPVVLALILGPMAERNLLNSIQMSRGDVIGYFISRPLCWLFFILIAASLLAPFRAEMKKRKESKQ